MNRANETLATPTSQVEQQLSTLTKTIAELQEKLYHLEGRLVSVLPSNPKQPLPEQATQPATETNLVPLAEQLLGQVTMLRRLNTFTQELLESIEL